MRTIRPGRQRPDRVLFTNREQAGGLYPSGLSQNPPKQTGAGPSGYLVVQIKRTPSERQWEKAHFYTLLPECIRAPCGAAARIADGSPLQTACIAPLRPRSTPLAPLCGLSPLTLLHCFLPAGHAKHGVTPSGVFNRAQSGQSGAWGNPSKLHGNIENDIPMPCLPFPKEPPLSLWPQTSE